ncbi:MAG: 4,5-dihydroxyphthalate decarboxylase [Xanthobacteraceae bacterium]
MTIQKMPEHTKASGDRREAQIVQDGATARLHLTMATADYDHVRDLVHGLVRPDGIVLTPLVMEVEEIFHRFIKNLEWDVSEMSFAKYTSLTAQGAAPMVAIPVFPSRVFRHSSIYIRRDRGIAAPKDLENRTIGIPEWAQTAGIYARGMLAEFYGVDLTKIRWVQTGVNQPGRAEKVELKLPAGIRYESRGDASLSDLLAKGEIDAVMSARMPDAFAQRPNEIARLFPNYRDEEMRYFRETRVFPIMHAIAIRRTVFERHPWIAMNLFKAFEEAKNRSAERVADITAARIPLPWSAALAGEFAATFGPDLFPYGVEANRPTLEAFSRFAHQQGITERQMSPDELFPREVRASAKV